MMEIERTDRADPTQDHGAFIGSAIGCAVMLSMLIGLSLATANNRELAREFSQAGLAPISAPVVTE
jgi:hypothetical protein